MKTDQPMRVAICADCLIADAGGGDTNPHHPGLTRGAYDPRPLSRLAGYLIGPDCDIHDNDAHDRHAEGFFSWAPCDGCGSSLGGQRWDMLAVKR